MAEEERFTGVVAPFVDRRGFGFIEWEENVLINLCENVIDGPFHPGQEVEFSLATDDWGNKTMKAMDVTPLAAAPSIRSTAGEATATVAEKSAEALGIGSRAAAVGTFGKTAVWAAVVLAALAAAAVTNKDTLLRTVCRHVCTLCF